MERSEMAISLGKFASFLEEKAAPYITTALALEWAMQRVDHPPSHWAQRLGFVRVFARHWSATDPPPKFRPPVYSHFERGESVLIFTPNRRFRGCQLLPKASPAV
jgi:hypothetical protein